METSTVNNERQWLTREEVEQRIPTTEHIHTFVGGGNVLLGCDMKREHILELASKEKGAELAGDTATAMKHGICIWDEGRAIFVETTE